MTLARLWKVYRTARSGDFAANTIAADHQGVLAAEAMGITRVEELSLIHTDAYKAERRAAGRSPCTINKALCALRAMLEWALDRKLIKTNPLAAWTRMPDKGTRKARAFSLEEVHSLLAAARPQWLLLWQLYLCTGMRRNEGLFLEWGEVDGSIINLGAGRTKTREERPVYLGPRMAAGLEALPRSGELVFPNPETAQAYNSGSVRREMRSAAKRAGWTNLHAVSPHTLRRTFITLALKVAKLSSPDVGKLVGHTLPGGSPLTEGTYYVPDPAHLQGEATRMEELILGKEA